MKKNVLLFASTFPRWETDAITARFVYDLGRELIKYFNVYVLTPHAPGAKRYEEMEGMKVVRFPYFLPLNSQALVDGTGMLSCLRTKKSSILQIPFFIICQYLALKKMVKTYQIDLVNSHWMIPQGLIGALLKKKLGYKLLLTIHAAGLFTLRRLPMGKPIAKYIVKNSDAIYCVSSYNQRMLNDLVKQSVEAHVLPMGIHMEFYNEEFDKESLRRELGLKPGKIILFVGKLAEKKGVTYLLQAYKMLLTKMNDVHLVIVGGGILEQALKAEAEALDIGSQVNFTGYKNKEEIKRYFKASDVAVIPSIIDAKGETEGLPVVLLEALACGKPVVATQIGGNPDVVTDRENGYMVEQKNAEALDEKIRLILEKGPQSFSQNSVASASPFDWEKIGLDYKDKMIHLMKN